MSLTKHVALTDPRLAPFWTERHLQTLTTLRRNGTPHTVPVAAVLDIPAGLVRILASKHSVKARNVARVDAAPVSVCQVDGRYWSTVEGLARIVDDPESIAAAETAYAKRFRTPRVNPDRIVIEVSITRVMGSLPTNTTESGLGTAR